MSQLQLKSLRKKSSRQSLQALQITPLNPSPKFVLLQSFGEYNQVNLYLDKGRIPNQLVVLQSQGDDIEVQTLNVWMTRDVEVITVGKMDKASKLVAINPPSALDECISMAEWLVDNSQKNSTVPAAAILSETTIETRIKKQMKIVKRGEGVDAYDWLAEVLIASFSC